MRPIRLLSLAALCLALLSTAGSTQAPAKLTLESFDYAGLSKEIRDLRGKVVVVYFWSFG